MMSSQPYDRYGKPYNVSRVLFPSNHTLNEQAYIDYSHLYLPLNYAIVYMVSFALYACALVHTVLYYGPALLSGLRGAKIEEDDIHAKLMNNYPEVPDWWYGTVFIIFFVMGMLAIALSHTDVPIWSLLVGLLFPLLYMIPSGFVYAYTGQPVMINVMSKAFAGALFSGRPFINMVFKEYSSQTMASAINFIQGLKLGHYIKVPPWATFKAQIVATVATTVVQVMVQARFSTSPTSSAVSAFYPASVVWGAIGPTRQFGPGTLYRPEIWAILFGAVIPIPFWLWQRQYPESSPKMISTPILLNGVAQLFPSTGINFSSHFVVAFVFQYLVRRRNFQWWSKYNYILSFALDSGTVISALCIFFALEVPKGGTIQVNWWGNNVFVNAVDGLGTVPLLSTGPEGFD